MSRSVVHPSARLSHSSKHVLIYLLLIHLFSTIISPHECHHNHSYHPSPHHFSLLFQPQNFLFFPILAFIAIWHPFRTDFMDPGLVYGFFLRFSFFSSFSFRYFLLFWSFLSQASYLTHNRLFFKCFFYCFSFF